MKSHEPYMESEVVHGRRVSEEQLQRIKRKFKERLKERGHLNVFIDTDRTGKELEEYIESKKKKSKERYGYVSEKIVFYTDKKKVERKGIEIDIYDPDWEALNLKHHH